jgi:hypothetical protein
VRTMIIGRVVSIAPNLGVHTSVKITRSERKSLKTDRDGWRLRGQVVRLVAFAEEVAIRGCSDFPRS